MKFIMIKDEEEKKFKEKGYFISNDINQLKFNYVLILVQEKLEKTIKDKSIYRSILSQFIERNKYQNKEISNVDDEVKYIYSCIKEELECILSIRISKYKSGDVLWKHDIINILDPFPNSDLFDTYSFSFYLSSTWTIDKKEFWKMEIQDVVDKLKVLVDESNKELGL